LTGKRGRATPGTLTQFLARRDWLLAKIFAIAGAAVVAVLVWSIWPYWVLSGEFRTLPEVEPSRLYARPVRLAPGLAFGSEALVAKLDALGYRPVAARGLVPGSYRVLDERVEIARRRFRAPVGDGGGGLLAVDFDGARIRRLALDEGPVAESWLEPPLLASWYGPDLMERRPAPLDEIPTVVVRAVLAAEDAAFFEHPGLSPTGIARALWTNLRGGEVRQGGSTITQQLAKNLYLTSERTVGRKAREAMLAIFLELRYDKEEILEAYLNQIFWGRSGSANLIGVGAAARAWFGRPVAELDLAEAALLAAMIKSPVEYSPLRKPEAARKRRDFVLGRLVELGWVEEAAAAAAREAPLPARDEPLTRRRAPYYVEAVEEELARRFGVADPADRGLAVHGTLDLGDQEAAEAAVREGLEGLLDKSERVRKKEQEFQGALVSIEPASGAVRAWVGGRDWAASQFDRVGQARRQAGSAFKPLVFAAAFEAGVATPATLLEDAPLEIESGGKLWQPQNDDDEFRGWVTARTAVEQSLNVPTARLALQTGLPKVVDVARRCGISTRLQAVPSIALGAFEVSPVELLTCYATIGNRGVRPPVHRVAAVFDRAGEGVAGEPLPAPETALAPETAYLVTTLLQGVLDYGTGRQARALGLADPVAGKTGTSNQRRDNWFVGFAPERATLVWVGFDDDSPTPFSGSRASLPIWTSFMKAVRPPGGYSKLEAPGGVRVVLIDPATGELATDRCPDVLAEAFPEGRLPSRVCHEHGGWFAQPIDPGIRAERDEKEGGLRNWLKRVFGRENEPDGPRERAPQGPPP
jgi:penicillin-binding protein 1B